MTTKEMRSDVCKRANELMKEGYTRKGSFKMAWAEIKKFANSVKAENLVAGDVIRIEYGYVNNFVECTITEVCIKSGYSGAYVAIKGISKRGMCMDFTDSPEVRYEKVA